MFNEILTGKATLEPKADPAGPYREPGVLPPVKHACLECRQPYEAPGGSAQGHCPACRIAIAQRNAAHSAQTLAHANDWHRREEQKTWVVRVVIGIVVAIGLGMFRYAMEKQYRDDMRQAHGYHSYDY